ncbi:low temperature-induced protein lt101.2-like [Nymphaea colorata]|uniref:low temperature-induced protein lt101.2-like n=1 Tax=Nymphaea colorata TaxID=210225 RepID=UPI00129E26C5|nr:low temperature-induced protein lt101.2-like [Nymphaea colorata]
MDPERRLRALIFLEVLIAIVLPPLGVFLRHGCRVEFWICLLLTILGYLPGIIYAVYAIVVINHDRYRYDYYQPIVA